jgi:hypothetical protein
VDITELQFYLSINKKTRVTKEPKTAQEVVGHEGGTMGTVGLIFVPFSCPTVH